MDRKYKVVGQPCRKKDSMQLLLGKPVYTSDVVPGGALVVRLLRSPHANAMVKSVDVSLARKVPGVVDVYTWQDVPATRFAIAGQTYPERDAEVEIEGTFQSYQDAGVTYYYLANAVVR